MSPESAQFAGSLVDIADLEKGVTQVLHRDHAGRAQSLLAATDFLQGRVVEQGACESIFGNPQHAVTRALLEAVPKGL